ncbi:unnamed protein product, partial [Staurois parvus]
MPKFKKKWRVGPPQNPYQTLMQHASRRSGKKGGRASTPPRTIPGHILSTWGGALGQGGSPPKHLVPMLMGTRASSPQLWPVVVGVCGQGAYRNLEAPF